MSNEAAVRKLMQKCDNDPALFARLVAHPQEVAKEHGATLEQTEIDQLSRVHKLQQLIDEFKTNRPGLPPHSGYPAEMAWKTVLANHIILYRPSFYPIFYPIWDGAIRNFEAVSQLKIPWWKLTFYPGPEGPSGWRGVSEAGLPTARLIRLR